MTDSLCASRPPVHHLLRLRKQITDDGRYLLLSGGKSSTSHKQTHTHIKDKLTYGGFQEVDRKQRTRYSYNHFSQLEMNSFWAISSTRDHKCSCCGSIYPTCFGKLKGNLSVMSDF